MTRFLFICYLLLSFEGRSNPFPVQIVKGLLVSKAVIEGKEVLVIFDTGAPGLVLNKNYFTSDNADVIPCYGVNGNFETQSHVVSEWKWLGTTHSKTTALVSDLSFLEKALNKKVYALIGLSAVQDYFITIDYDRSSITLSDKFEFDKKEAIRFQYADHLPVITCKVNGKKQTLGIDTGAEANYLFSAQPNSQELASAIPYLVTGTDNQQNLMHSIEMNIDVNLTSEISSEFLVDQDNINQHNITSFDGLLGQNFLANYTVSIHPTRQLLVLTLREQERNFPVAVNP